MPMLELVKKLAVELGRLFLRLVEAVLANLIATIITAAMFGGVAYAYTSGAI